MRSILFKIQSNDILITGLTDHIHQQQYRSEQISDPHRGIYTV